MKTGILYLSICMTLFLSCSPLKKTAQATAYDGSAYDKAIVIHEDHEKQGIADEYAWIRSRYPGSKTKSQSLNNYKNRPYDIIHIVTDDGKEVAVYFDISNFFGKY